MGTVRQVKGKRGVRWRAEVCVGTIRDSDTFGSRQAARHWISEREAELGRGGAQTVQRTLAGILTRYSTDVSPAHKGERWEKLRIAKIIREFDGVNRPIRDLTADDIGRWRDARLKSVAAPSVKREMTLLRAALNHACREWRYLTREKLDDLRGAAKPADAPARKQRVPDAARTAIIEALGYAEDEPVETVRQRVALVFLLALETAMRCGELCGIMQADLELKRRFVRLPETKNGDAREVPLTMEAVRLFGRAPKVTRGDPILGLAPSQVDANFRKARNTTNWGAIHFHDSRAEALTRLSRKVDMLTLARIAGHRDPRSLSVYYRESAEDIAGRL